MAVDAGTIAGLATRTKGFIVPTTPDPEMSAGAISTYPELVTPRDPVFRIVTVVAVSISSAIDMTLNLKDEVVSVVMFAIAVRSKDGPMIVTSSFCDAILSYLYPLSTVVANRE